MLIQCIQAFVACTSGFSEMVEVLQLMPMADKAETEGVGGMIIDGTIYDGCSLSPRQSFSHLEGNDGISTPYSSEK